MRISDVYCLGIDARVHLGSAPASGRLIGRARECRALESLLDAVRGGESRVLVLHGDAGTGKSALLRHLVTEASGFHVMHATAVESEMELPFATLHQLYTAMMSLLPSLPEPQAEAARTAFGLVSGKSPDRLLIGLAALNLLSSASDAGPVLCVVDDAHWMDAASLHTLAFVARRLHAEPVALVIGTRTLATDLADLPGLAVEGLRDGDAQTLLSEVVRVPLDARVRDRIVAETRGNPLALIEWPRGKTARELAGGFGLPDELPMSTQIEELFGRRLAALPSATQRFLTLAAADPTGDPVCVWRAAGQLGLGPDAAAPAIESDLVDVGMRVRFRHPLIRSAAYRMAPLADRHEAHRAIASVIDGAIEPDRRAWHRALGSPGPDEEIAGELVQSADRARARGGLAAAGALLERAVALSLDPKARAERIMAAAVAAVETGSFESAASLIGLADASSLDDLDRARLDLLRSRLTVIGGDFERTAPILLRAAQRFEAVDVTMARAAYLQTLATTCTLAGFERETSTVDVAAAARRCPPPAEPGLDHWLLTGLSTFSLEGPAVAAPALRRALDDAMEGSMIAERFHLLGLQCAAASIVWDHASIRRLAALQIDATREIGALRMLPAALNTLSHVLVIEGDLVTPLMLIAEAEAINEATGSSLLCWAVPFLLAWRSDPDAVQRCDEVAASAARSRNGVAFAASQWARVVFYTGRGEYELSLRTAIEATKMRWPWGGHFYIHELVEAAVRCHDEDTARSAVVRLAESAEASETDWGLGLLARSRALLTSGEAAEDLYRESIDRLARTSVRPELARSHLVYGEWLRRENRRVDARAQLRIAHEQLSTLEIRGFAERARRELMATGEKVRSRVVSAVDELTPQESHIARLAADGYTNPEIGERLFISPRTVEWHLKKVFTKLGLTSRRELRTALPAPVEQARSE